MLPFLPVTEFNPSLILLVYSFHEIFIVYYDLFSYIVLTYFSCFEFQDVNDETPTFRNPSYVAEISENSPRATPILFLGGNNVLPEVFDHDSGTNGTFQLFLEGDLGIFEV